MSGAPHFLDQDHPAMRASPALRARAANLILDAALQHAARVRLEFDREPLLAALGAQAPALLPGLSPQPARGPLDRHEAPLDPARAQLLRRALSFEREDEFPDPPLNYVERAVLFDDQGNVLLRLSDGGDSLLFALPPDEHDRLIERYRREGIPPDAVPVANVDIAQGL